MYVLSETQLPQGIIPRKYKFKYFQYAHIDYYYFFSTININMSSNLIRSRRQVKSTHTHTYFLCISLDTSRLCCKEYHYVCLDVSCVRRHRGAGLWHVELFAGSCNKDVDWTRVLWCHFSNRKYRKIHAYRPRFWHIGTAATRCRT